VKPVTRPKRTLFGTFFDVRNLKKVSEGAGRDRATCHAPPPSRLRLRTDSGSVAQAARNGGERDELREGSSESGTTRRLRPADPITRRLPMTSVIRQVFATRNHALRSAAHAAPETGSSSAVFIERTLRRSRDARNTASAV